MKKIIAFLSAFIILTGCLSGFVFSEPEPTEYTYSIHLERDSYYPHSYADVELEFDGPFGNFEAYFDKLEWTVSNDKVAIIEDYGGTFGARVYFKRPGEVTIIATHPDHQEPATVTVTVIEGEPIYEDKQTGIFAFDNSTNGYYTFTPSVSGYYTIEFKYLQKLRFEIEDYNGFDEYFAPSNGKEELYLEGNVKYYLIFYNLGSGSAVTISRRTAPATVESVSISSTDNTFYADSIDKLLASARIHIETTDGLKGTFSIGDSAFGNIITASFQSDPKKKNYGVLTVSCGGKTDTYQFNIIDFYVTEVVIDQAPSYQYFYGDISEGYWNSPKGGFVHFNERYKINPCEIQDLIFTLTFSDGSKKQYKGTDIDLIYKILDGFDCSIYLDEDIKETPVGEYRVNLDIDRLSASYTVKVIENDKIKSLELVKESQDKEYNYNYFADIAGMQFKINYFDKRSKLVKVTRQNLRYINNDKFTIELDDGSLAYIHIPIYSPDRGQDNPVIRYMGRTCELDFLEYKEDYKPYDEILMVDNYSSDLKKCNVYFAKNGTKSVKIELSKLPERQIISYKTEYSSNQMYYFVFVEGKYMFGYAHCNTSDDIPTYFNFTLGGAKKNDIYINQNLKLKGVFTYKKPDKIRYNIGEKFDGEGYSLGVEYTNGLKGYKWYVPYDLTFSSVDTSTVGKKKVTATYKGFKTTFEIEVTNGFADVKNGKWYKPYVDYAYSYGIFDGTDNVKKLFSPEQNITRAQFVKVLSNIAKVDTSNNNISSGFKDVPKNKWYTGAVKWAAENGIVSGMGDGTFKPDEKITREQMCVMLVSFVEDYNGSLLVKKIVGKKFIDENEISAWAKDAVDKCQRAGLINGLGDGSFAPKGYATRAQGATIFYGYCKDNPVHSRELKPSFSPKQQGGIIVY